MVEVLKTCGDVKEVDVFKTSDDGKEVEVPKTCGDGNGVECGEVLNRNGGARTNGLTKYALDSRVGRETGEATGTE